MLFWTLTYAQKHIYTRTQAKCPISFLPLLFSVLSPPLCIPVSCLKTKGAGSPRAAECAEVRGRPPADFGLLLVLLLWIQLYIHIGSLTLWPIAPWLTSWCQTARNSRLQDTVYNNSTHLYRINRLNQFPMLSIVSVSLCFLSVCLPKRLEITCVQHSANVFSLYSVFFGALFISKLDNLVFICLLLFLFFFILRR